jgi:hypothetical protein
MILKQHKDYLITYNNLLSQVSTEFNQSFASIASPTLSKQETVTYLYNNIQDYIVTKNKIKFPTKRLIQFIPRLIITFFKLIYISYKYRIDNIPANTVYFRSWLVPRSLNNGNYYDDYFRNLPLDLSNYENVLIGINSLDIKLLRKCDFVNSTIVNSNGLLSFKDILRVFYFYLKNGLIRARNNYFYNDTNITFLINKTLLNEYLCLNSFEAYLEYEKSKKLLKFNIKAYCYIFENQSWEKSACYVFKNTNVKVIAYQSSGFSPIFLNFYPTLQDSHNHPMPNIILTVGDYFTKYLNENGHFNIPIKTFGALRFEYKNDGLKYLVSLPNKKILNKILYAFSVHINFYNQIIADLIEIFKNTSIMVDLKLHPIYYNNFKFNIILPSNFKIIDQFNNSELSNNYDFILFNDSSYGIEAILCGVKSFQYNRNGNFLDNRFFYFNLWNPNIDYNDLINLRDELLTKNFNKDYDYIEASNYINSMYKPYTGNIDIFRQILL